MKRDASLTLSFDIGYASIGWCVLSTGKPAPASPEILGAGVVTFRAHDCLTSQRRGLRRTRRHIRSTRQRIERLKKYLEHIKFLSREDLDLPGHPAPFLLAAAAHDGTRVLTALELWHVIRWYAHNRGYDGNSRWSRQEDRDEDDTEKVIAAKEQMAQHDTSTMAHTICALLDLDPKHPDQKISSFLPYKTLNTAYPRSTVTAEVERILHQHLDKLPGLTPEAMKFLISSDKLSADNLAVLPVADIKLPKRYHGGLLFGQLVPRFDNRIITRCPITWAEIYQREVESGTPVKEASRLAERDSKVPAKKSPEFFRYRFARLLANLRADGESLAAELRKDLFERAESQGHLSTREIKAGIQAALPGSKTNVDAHFKIHPDSEDALTLDPVLDEVRKAEGSHAKLSPFWKHLPEVAKAKAVEIWRNRDSISLEWVLAQAKASENLSQLEDAIEKAFLKANKPKNGKAPYLDLEDYLSRTTIAPKIPSERAPYARPVLRRVVEEVLCGHDPTKPAQSANHPEGESKAQDGVLYPLLDPNSEVNRLQQQRPLDKLTNNHLVRHRLLILSRLVEELVEEFAANNPSKVARVVVEVGRELKEFSGKTAKEISTELNNRLKHFKGAVRYLEKNAPDLKVTGGLLRKTRIAIDMDWRCPFTGENYDAYALNQLDREHIVPFASRQTNALHALVLTFPELNRMKGNRTARQFIVEDGGNPVDGRPNLSLLTVKNYDALVANLDTKKGHDDDRRRKNARKALLATTEFEERQQDFTPGDLTQSSYLMKLALGNLKQRFPEAVTIPIPGLVNAEIRKAWNLLGTLAQACPEVIDPDTGEPTRDKGEVRSLTHLHHALDAATLALGSHYLPGHSNGRIWEALVRRRKTPEDWKILRALKIIKKDSEGRLHLVAPPDEVKNQLAARLAEARVTQHIPASRSGTKAELTTWSIVGYDGAYTILLQRINRGSLKAAKETDDKRWEDQPTKDATKKLLGTHGQLLSPRQRNLVNRGILKLTLERTSKLLGPFPTSDNSKLTPHGKGRGAIVIEKNFGIALDPEPRVILFHQVQKTLQNLVAENQENPVRVIRNGSLLKVKGWQGKEGLWQVRSCKASLTLDLARPHEVKNSWREVSVKTLISKGLEILPHRYSGHTIRE